jgi:hypothetical protein
MNAASRCNVPQNMTRAWIVALTLLFAACARVEIEPPKNTDGLTSLSSGAFYNVVHNASGTATLYRRTDGSRFMRLQNFSVDAGPDLFVYTSSLPKPISRDLGNEDAVLDLGQLNASQSDYEIPANAKLEDLRSVVIWCRAFSVNFASASLETTP